MRCLGAQVAPDAQLGYAIHFENLPQATAPAQVVVVTADLDGPQDDGNIDLSEVLGAAREFAGQGIRIISVSPTIVDTPFQDINAAGAFERAVSNIPLKRAGRPDEIGELVLFLCSDACEMMVAETVYVTGGRQ